MKNNKAAGLCIIAGTIILMALLSAFQIFLFKGDEEAGTAMLLRLSAVNWILAAGGMTLLFLWAAKFLNSLKSSKDALEKNQASLAQFYQILKAHSDRSAEATELLRNEGIEREAEAAHLREVLDLVTGQFSEIEGASVQAIGAIDLIENYFSSLRDAAAEQERFIANAENRLDKAAEPTGSVSFNISETEGKAGSLKKEAAMGEEQSHSVHELIKGASENLEKITEMTGAINQISEQTNILSMNAAIESAHAGSAGAGFAVVAKEIKKLAGSTKENAKNIQDAIKAVTRQIAEALKASELSSGSFGSLSKEIQNLAESLNTVHESAQKNRESPSAAESAILESASIIRKIHDNSADMMANQQSFRSALEQIHALSGKTRAEIKEIRTGTQDALENIAKTQDRIRETLAEAGKLGEGLALGAPSPAVPAKPAAPAKPPAPARPSFEADNSWRKDVAVKSPPLTIW
ncbi:methyl-accepting chemotaxis protein [Leadbettera azotonutricia]|nr:methyl-accepting chemotaxis protein [Leadbettera azotonutricia]